MLGIPAGGMQRRAWQVIGPGGVFHPKDLDHGTSLTTDAGCCVAFISPNGDERLMNIPAVQIRLDQAPRR